MAGQTNMVLRVYSFEGQVPRNTLNSISGHKAGYQLNICYGSKKGSLCSEMCDELLKKTLMDLLFSCSNNISQKKIVF